MKELNFTIDESLRQGLRRDVRQPSDSVGLSKMKNLIPSAFGAVSPRTITYPISDPALSIDWPFPQLFRGQKTTLLAGKEVIRTVDESDWSTSATGLYKSRTPGTPGTIPGNGGPWHHASFQDKWAMTNGTGMVFSMPSNVSDKVFLDDENTYQSLCNHNERLVFGGCAGTFFAGSRWAKVFNAWRESPNSVFTHEDTAFDTNWVVWGEPLGGADDIPHHVFLAALGVFGDAAFDKVEELILSAVESGAIGMTPLRTPGSVLGVLPLGDGIIVYGARGVSRLTPSGQSYVEGPLHNIGIASRSAFGGDTTGHIYIDDKSQLWKLAASGAPELLGYEEFMDDLTAADIVITRDEYDRDLWITDGTTCYVLTPSDGLGGPMDIKPTGLIRIGSNLYGAANGLSITPTIAEIRSGETDLAERGTKHITTLQIFKSGMTGVQSQNAYRYADVDSFSLTAWTKANRQGVTFPRVSFVDGIVAVKGTVTADDARVWRVEVRYNAEDRRFRRGTKGVPG